MPFDNEPGLERGPSSRRVRILVVDDHPDIVETFSRLIRMSGYEVVAARDGGDALKKAAEFHPSIILLDIGLPVLDGYEVIRRLRVEAEFRATPVVAVTGYDGEEDRLRIRDAGFDGHLVKPVPLDVLLETLSRFAAGLA
jgi:two-component system, chemotaxis family, CheB/CheR fusion protein